MLSGVITNLINLPANIKTGHEEQIKEILDWARDNQSGLWNSLTQANYQVDHEKLRSLLTEILATERSPYKTRPDKRFYDAVFDISIELAWQFPTNPRNDEGKPYDGVFNDEDSLTCENGIALPSGQLYNKALLSRHFTCNNAYKLENNLGNNVVVPYLAEGIPLKDARSIDYLKANGVNVSPPTPGYVAEAKTLGQAGHSVHQSLPSPDYFNPAAALLVRQSHVVDVGPLLFGLFLQAQAAETLERLRVARVLAEAEVDLEAEVEAKHQAELQQAIEQSLREIPPSQQSHNIIYRMFAFIGQCLQKCWQKIKSLFSPSAAPPPPAPVVQVEDGAVHGGGRHDPLSQQALLLMILGAGLQPQPAILRPAVGSAFEPWRRERVGDELDNVFAGLLQQRMHGRSNNLAEVVAAAIVSEDLRRNHRPFR